MLRKFALELQNGKVSEGALFNFAAKNDNVNLESVVLFNEELCFREKGEEIDSSLKEEKKKIVLIVYHI